MFGKRLRGCCTWLLEDDGVYWEEFDVCSGDNNAVPQWRRERRKKRVPRPGNEREEGQQT